MSSYHAIMAEVAAMFGQTLDVEGRLTGDALRIRKSAHNGTYSKVLQALPPHGGGSRSCAEVAIKTGLPAHVVRQALRDLCHTKRAVKERTGVNPYTIFRYSRVKYNGKFNPKWPRIIHSYIQRKRGHWLRPSDIVEALGLPKHVKLQEIIGALHQCGVIQHHQISEKLYQVRWLPKKQRPPHAQIP